MGVRVLKFQLFLLFLLLVFLIYPSSTSTSVHASFSIDYRSIVNEINMSRIREHVRFFSSLTTRYTGSLGADIAANYIYQEFLSAGLSNVQFQTFDVVVPIDQDSYIYVTNEKGENFKIKVYPLAPNLVMTSNTGPEGISGKLIYVGAGEPENLKEIREDINGSIVLMKYNSRGENWINVAMFGARAVIFMEPDTEPLWTTAKFLPRVPLKFPRFYVRSEDSLKLLSLAKEGNVTAVLKCNQSLEVKKGKNIFGLIKGEDFPDEVIAITAHYDSWSIVPSLSPGAEDSIGISVLLELARFFKQHPPKRTILFIAFSGFWQSMAGSRAFIEEYWFNTTNFGSFGSKIKVAFSLDFSTDSDSVGVFPWGQFYHGHPERLLYYRWLESRIFGTYLPEINAQMPEKNYKVDNCIISVWAQFSPSPIVFDAETFTVAGGFGAAFHTTNSLRISALSPLDTFEKVNFNNLERQVEPVTLILYSLLTDPAQISEVGSPIPTRRMKGGGTNLGFGRIYGKVMMYDMTTGRYKEVPNAFVAIIEKIELISGRDGAILSSMPNTYFNLIVKTDSEGRFDVRGVRTGMQDMWTDVTYSIYSFLINSSNGNIEGAIDMGRYGTKGAPPDVTMSFEEIQISSFIFKCGSITTYGLLDYQDMKTALRFTILDLASFSEAIFYGYQGDTTFAPWINIFYVEPELKTGFLGFMGPDIRAAIINEGKGYTVKAGEHMFIYLTPLSVARDMLWLNEDRFNILHSYNIYSPGRKAEEYYSKAEFYINRAHENVIDYIQRYADVFSAWNFAGKSYTIELTLIKDVINTMWIYTALVIPFAFLFERLVMDTRGFKRLFAVVLIIAVFTYLLYLLHPGFKLASNPMMVIISLSVAILAFPVLFIFFEKVLERFKVLRLQIRGAHFAASSKLSAFMLAFSVGVANMRRRKTRTSLTLITVILIVFSLISLTSICFSVEVLPVDVFYGLHKSYDGLLVRAVPYGELNLQLLDYMLSYTDKAVVSSRVWLYPIGHTNRERIGTFEISTLNGNRYSLKAMLGMMPEEYEFNKVLKVRGRWFIPEDTWVIILSNSTAASLRCDINEQITLLGINFTVIGIIDDENLENSYDPDGQRILPVNWMLAAGEMGAAAIEAPHMHSNEIALIPFKTALALGQILPEPASGIYTITLIFENENEAAKAAEDISFKFSNIYVFLGLGEETRIYRPVTVAAAAGISLLIFPTIIGIMVILNTLLGSIHERTNEISTLASLGLSPFDISGMFFAESIIYAIIGSTIGFILGISGMNIFYWLGILPKDFNLNYSSSFVAMSLGLAIMTMILASIYPLRISSKQVTPSLERKWTMPKPKGDEWIVKMPFRMDEKEINGCLAFMKEYLESFRGQRIGDFDVENITFKTSVDDKGNPIRSLIMKVGLAPWEYGVTQDVKLIAIRSPEDGMWSWEIHVHRLTGLITVWRRANRIFLDSMRKQLLMWRSLTPLQRERYVNQFREILEG